MFTNSIGASNNLANQASEYANEQNGMARVLMNQSDISNPQQPHVTEQEHEESSCSRVEASTRTWMAPAAGHYVETDSRSNENRNFKSQSNEKTESFEEDKTKPATILESGPAR